MPHNDHLNESQKTAKHIASLELRTKKGVILDGPAGFGKTFLLKHLIKIKLYSNVLVLADTNQAVNILKESIGNIATFKTVCSALGYQMQHTTKGLELVQVTKPDWKEYDLVILDEASQLSQNRLEEVKAKAKRLLIAGDEFQAPPVGELYSPAFSLPYKKVSLTIPMRNSTEIFDFCQKVRATIGTNKRLPEDFQVSPGTFNNIIYDNLLEFKKGNAVILAFSERGKHFHKVDDYNKMLKEALFGPGDEPKVGERIVLKRPYAAEVLRSQESKKKSEEIALVTNQRGTILKAEETLINVLGLSVFCYKVILEMDDYKGIKLKAYMPKSETESSYVMARHAAFGRKNQKALKEFFGKWIHFQSAYSTNAYVSQGLSISKVFVDLADLVSCTRDKLLLRQKLFYVCVSRAVNELYIKAK